MNKHDSATLAGTAAAWLYAQFTQDPLGTYALLLGALVMTIRAIIAVSDIVKWCKARFGADK